MNPGSSLRAAAGLVAAVFLVAIAGFPALAADPPAPSEIRLTLDVEDQPLEEALAALAALIGQDIEVTGRIDERKVSVNLHEAPFGSINRDHHPRPRALCVAYADGRVFPGNVSVQKFPGQPQYPVFVGSYA